MVGFKPPFGRVPQIVPYNLDQYSHVGPLARTVADCALFENVLAGPHRHDIVSMRPKLEIPAELEGIRGWKIALSPNLGAFRIDADVAANLLLAADALREAGASVDQIELSWTSEQLGLAAQYHFGSIMGAFVKGIVAEHPDLVCDYTANYAGMMGDIELQDFNRGLDIEGALYWELGEILETYDALICPTLGIPALTAGESYVDHGPEIDGIEQHVFDHLLTAPFNVMSRCPVMSVPSGFSRDGIPTGMQIVGRTYDDVSVFRIAAAYERIRPWMDAPERRPIVWAINSNGEAASPRPRMEFGAHQLRRRLNADVPESASCLSKTSGVARPNESR